MREIGRLRELAFRRVGEGTGTRRDLDRFDAHYHHIVLWDEEALAVVGVYRLGEARPDPVALAVRRPSRSAGGSNGCSISILKNALTAAAR